MLKRRRKRKLNVYEQIVHDEIIKEIIRQELFGDMPQNAKAMREWLTKKKAELEAQGEVINFDIGQRLKVTECDAN